ncbi:MAG: protein kinase [Actinobacteria bacterium]|nr:protein kinase [Actinomycetota bacterium]
MDPDVMVGTDVGGYSIESVLGRGAMGVVYVARQRSPERKVALKLIHPAFAGDETFLIALTSDTEGGDFCYLTDFGVSMWTASSAATITATGRMVGTADYVAPEQIESSSIDGRADLYSLGCVLYECLAGRPPFAGRSPPATLYAHLHEEAAAPSAVRPGLPPVVDAVVARALRKTPQERYGSCRELTQDLRAALAGSTGTTKTSPRAPVSRRPPTAAPRRRRAAWIAAATVLILAAAGFAFAELRGQTTRQEGSSPSAAPPRLIREGVQVTASNTAPSSHDASGNIVTYVPANVVDGDVQTAWRTAGDGRGEWVTLIFENPIEVVRIGLIPGYAKTDPQTGANRFLQDRIITSVRYQISGFPPVTQTFRPVPVPQFVELRATTSLITVKILGTSKPGGLDYTAISEIYVYGYRQ